MIQYQTKRDRLQQVIAAIIPGSESETGRAIYIDLLTITDSSEENHSNYQIKHGNFFPDRFEEHITEEETILVEKATWDQFYIDGKDDGFPNGFKTLDEVELFISQEVERIEKKKTQCIISNDNTADGARGYQWGRVLIAWKGFKKRFLDAKNEGKLIDVEQAKQMRDSLMN